MMTTYDEAIAALVASGIPATRRHWALGDTIVVPLGHPSVRGDIALHPSVAWLVPGAGHSWELVRAICGESSARGYPNLDAACRAAIDLARAFARFESCRACGAQAEVDFGEHAGESELKYWIAVRCPSCGSQLESDGQGPLPDELRQLEFERNGVWNVLIEPPLSPAQWAAVRTVLDVDLGRIAELERSLPLPIFQGTIAESTRVRNTLTRAGVNATLTQANATLA